MSGSVWNSRGCVCIAVGGGTWFEDCVVGEVGVTYVAEVVQVGRRLLSAVGLTAMVFDLAGEGKKCLSSRSIEHFWDHSEGVVRGCDRRACEAGTA